MSTIFDLITTAIFVFLAILFLQRSTAAEPRDHIYQYAPPAIGCAVANYVGNHNQSILAWALIAGIVIYVFVVLKPFTIT
jgi:hypothetical protein